MLGGFNEGAELDADQRALVMGLRPQIEERLGGGPLALFEPVKIRQQVVAGMNYRVLIKTGTDTYIHVKIFKPLPHTG